MAFPGRVALVLSWLRPQVLVVSVEHAAEDLEQSLHVQRAVQNREGSVTQRMGQSTDPLTLRGLPRPDDDRRRGGIQSPKQLQHPHTGGLRVAGRPHVGAATPTFFLTKSSQKQ